MGFLEKQATLPVAVPAPEKRFSRYKPLILVAVVATLFVSRYAVAFIGNSFSRCSGQKLSGDIIAWSACADLTEYQCAYLTVPLDYGNPLPNETVSLALRKLPATVPVSERMGTLFTNPGGPGGSGTNSVVRSGPAMHAILKGRYDILSWDPRGVNMTTPALDCYPTAYDQSMHEMRQSLLGLPSELRATGGDDAVWFEKTDAYFQSSIASCGRSGNQKMLESVSTAYVVRDMVSILEALGEKERGLQYWGFSYGTILGATFSAMFPDLVHRVLLDGVSDSVSYTRDMYQWGRSGMNDTNKVYAGFFEECAKAGPGSCALAGPNETAKSIETKIDTFKQGLLSHPMSIPFSGSFSGILTVSDVDTAFFGVLYAPKQWQDFAAALAEAIKGDGAPLALFAQGRGYDYDTASKRTSPLDNVFKRHMTMASEPLSTEAIMCSDTDRDALLPSAGAESSIAQFQEYAHELAEESVTGENWAKWVGRCRLWNVTAKETYRGPWTAEEGLKKTKYPVIFLGVTADPVTPLSAAQSMSLGFGNESATLLIQKGFGHCSPAHPSLCTARTLQKYFFDGEVPKYGTMCESDEGFVFPDAGLRAERMGAMSVEDRDLMEAMEKLSEVRREWGA